MTTRNRTLAGLRAAAALSRQKLNNRDAQIDAKAAVAAINRRKREESCLGRVVEQWAKRDPQFRHAVLDGVAMLAPTNRDASSLSKAGGMIDALREISSPAGPVAVAVLPVVIPVPAPLASPPAVSLTVPPAQPASGSKSVPVQRIWWAQDLTYDYSEAAMTQRLEETRIFHELMEFTSKPSDKREAKKRMEGVALRDGWRQLPASYRVLFFDTVKFPGEIVFPSAFEANLFLFNNYEPDVEIFCDDQPIDRKVVTTHSVLGGWSEQVEQAVGRLIEKGPPRRQRKSQSSIL